MARLKFNSDSDEQDVVTEINDICNSSNTSFSLKSKARRVNGAIDRFYTLAFQADGRWVWDDPSRDTDPIEEINLVSGTQSYNVGTFTSEVINILRVEVLDSNGDGQLLKRLDRAGLGTIALTEYQTANGTPTEYDLVGEYIFLYPAPNYASTNGLKFYVNRTHTAFASTDTTKTLPVPTLFDHYICRAAALPWLIENQKPQANQIAAMVARDEQAILDYFAHREHGAKRKMTIALRRWR